MATTSKIFTVLNRIRGILLRAFRRGFAIPQALKWILGRLSYCWALLSSRSRISSQKSQQDDPPSPALCSNTDAVPTIGPSDGQQDQKQALNFGTDYIPIIDGEIVSLQDVMLSVYPYSGDGLRSAAQSMKNLEVSRSAHASTISLGRSREPSLASASLRHPSANSLRSQHPGSSYSRSIRSSHSDISVSVIPPEPSPQIDSTNVIVTENRGDTRESPYSQPGITKPRYSDHLFVETTGGPPLENDDRKASGYELVELATPISETSLHDSACALITPLEVLGNERIIPIMPEAVSRYDGRPIISKSAELQIAEIQPLTKSFDRPYLPNGWVKLVHPEGACYFFNPAKRIYAEANLYDKDIHDQLIEDIAIIEDFLLRHNIQETDNDSDLVIHISRDDSGQLSASYYYYVDHKNRSIFFLDVYLPSSLSAWDQIYGGAGSPSHLRHEIETQYWFHCQYFPHSSKLTKSKVQELRDVVMHYVGDTMTSPKCSTAPYALEDLRNILALTKDMDQNVDGVSVGTHSCLARLMFIFTRARFLHFHGEPHARIDRTTSVYGDEVYQRTWLVKALSPILFFAPDFHLRNLQGMWVDQIMHKSVFVESMERMNEDWDRIVLFATVMLNANVAILGIHRVDTGTGSARTAPQIASYISMISSVGSIIVGLLLSRQNRTKSRETVDDFEKYMTDRHHPTHGLETLAILYSLPYALLMWGMLCFSLTVLFMCFMHSDIPTVSVVGVSSFFCVVFCLWCLYINWEKEDKEISAFPQTQIGRWLGQAEISLRKTFNLGRQPGLEVEQHTLA